VNANRSTPASFKMSGGVGELGSLKLVDDTLMPGPLSYVIGRMLSKPK